MATHSLPVRASIKSKTGRRAHGRDQTVSNVRALAARVLTKVINGRYLDAALEELFASHAQLSAHDAALIQELAYGSARWFHQLAGIARLFITKPLKTGDQDLHALILIGLYQLRYLRVAKHAGVDETVAAAEHLGKSWAKGLINACLRQSLRQDTRVAQVVAQTPELSFSHPAWLVEKITHTYGTRSADILGANNERPPMTLRVNCRCTEREGYIRELEAAGMAATTVPGVESALVLARPVPVERLPGFLEGRVSIQDAAAQLGAFILAPQPGQRVLDACAAPGGKAAHLLERAPDLDLTALDVDSERLGRLTGNLQRLHLRARVIAGDALCPQTWWDGQPYDRILLDVPCSATGVIRRHPDIKVRRRPEEIAQLTDNQARLLSAMWPCLKPGGKLLYITCSILPEENEEQVQGFIGRHRDSVRVLPLPGGQAGRHGLQILPGENGMDGFYYAYLQKK